MAWTKEQQMQASEAGANATRKAPHSKNGLRQCGKCGITKPVSEYWKSGGRRDKLHTWCKECCREGGRRSRQKMYETFEGRIKTFMRSCKHNSEKRGHEFSLTEQDFRDMWEDQHKLCAYTGIEMTTAPAMPHSVSVERIENDTGYTKENTILVCNFVNQMKSDLEAETFFEFCRAVFLWLSDEDGNLSVEFTKYG